MKRLHISEVEAKMVLAEPAQDALGRVLLEAGEELTDRYIHKLEAFGVERLCVRSGEYSPPSSTTPARLSEPEKHEILQVLQAKFANVVSEYRMKVLHDTVRRHLLEEND